MSRALPLAISAFVALAGAAVAAAGGTVHRRLVEATTVAVAYDADGRFVPEREARHSIDLTATERAALAGVRAALADWGRYTVVESPWDADLLVVVRPAHVAQVAVGGSIGGAPRPTRVASRSLRAEVATPWDVLSVYDAEVGGRPRSVLWSRQLRDGLLEEAPALVAHLRRHVEGLPRRP